LARTCLVCLSPNRSTYDSWFLKGIDGKRVTVKTIWRQAKLKFNEEIPYTSFVNHFRRHVEYVVKERVKSSKLREQIITEEIKRDIRIAKELTRNLDLCNQMINSLKTQLDDPEKYKLMLDVLSETRLIIEQFLRWGSKLRLEFEEEKEDVWDRIKFCLKDFPPDLIYEFTMRWEQYEQEKSTEMVR